MSAEEQRKLAAIMFTDMVGYSALRSARRKACPGIVRGTSPVASGNLPRF